MRLRDGILVTKTEGEYVAVATGEAALFFNGLIRLNEAAVSLVSRMQEEFTKEDLTDMLKKSYQVNEAEAERDVEQLLGRFMKEGLILGS